MEWPPAQNDNITSIAILRTSDDHLFVDECLCRIGVAFAHLDDEPKRKECILEVYDLLRKRCVSETKPTVMDTVWTLKHMNTYNL